MTPTLQELSWMALDAYDSRSRIQDTGAPSFADPAVEVVFPGWVHQPTSRASGPRNADASFNSGMEANVYVNDARGQVVVAFRGTEFEAFFNEVAQADIRTIERAGLDNDFLTFFGYYQDDGATLEDFFSEDGDLSDYLAETFTLDEDQTDRLDDLIGFLANLGLAQGVGELAELGEQDLRNQVESALVTILEVAAANPGREITLTGQSLGGALAASAAGALGIKATLFDPAPYAAEGLLAHAREKAEALLAVQPALDPAALGWDVVSAPEANLADLTETHRIEGSFVEGLYLTASPLDLPAGASTDRVIDIGAVLADPFLLHSPEMITLVLDSEARASEDRPSFESLSRALPGLVQQLDNPELVAPNDALTVANFLVSLMIADPFYAFFADLMERAIEEIAEFAPEGSAESRGPELERMLVDLSLRALGQTFAAGDRESPGTVADVYGDPAGSAGDDVMVGAFGVAETFAPGLGEDLIATGAGAADEVRGSFADLDGDTLFDVDAADSLFFLGESFGPGDVTFRAGGRVLEIAGPTDFLPAVTLALRQSADPATVVVTEEAGGTRLSFAASADGLSETEARDVARVYDAGLGRIADITGLNFWIDRREDGLTEIELAAVFYRSPEFADLVGGDPDGLDDGSYVGQLYVNILGRAGDTDGEDFWEAQLGIEGFGRDDLLLAFSKSAENIADQPEIERLFEIEDGVWDFV